VCAAAVSGSAYGVCEGSVTADEPWRELYYSNVWVLAMLMHTLHYPAQGRLSGWWWAEGACAVVQGIGGTPGVLRSWQP
jgi:hypothetical protein